LLASAILSDHFNGLAAAARFIQRHGHGLAISAITCAEVLAGFNKADGPLGKALLDNIRFLQMDADIADEGARIDCQTQLKVPDAIQAASLLAMV
jgi:predicted nucleic acid-binding protein